MGIIQYQGEPLIPHKKKSAKVITKIALNIVSSHHRRVLPIICLNYEKENIGLVFNITKSHNQTYDQYGTPRLQLQNFPTKLLKKICLENVFES